MNAAPTIEAQTFSVSENAAMDAAVGTVAATDTDGNDLTFAATSGNLCDAFAINASTGAITVAGALDHETTAAYTLTVRASGGPTSVDAAVTVNVTNVARSTRLSARDFNTLSRACNTNPLVLLSEGITF